ncbi:MAG: Ig-like domain-containing protein, partial [Candidatus Marinimicrobia bacterium]|nr:Ig-like domain-containing protein [Candidatus Neomarinimicrobiota bacterium]
VYYFNSNSVPSTATRTISFSVSDGSGFSTTSTRDITLNAVNNAPSLASIEGTTLAYTDGDPDTIITTSLAISDVDDYYLDTAWVTISANYVSGEDKLDFATANGITPSWSSVDGVLTLTGSAALTDYQSALRAVTYGNLNPDPATATRTISFKLSDGIDQSNIQSRNLSVTAINDAPLLSDIEGTGIVYNAGDGAVAITDSITISDGDDTQIDSAKVQITTNYFTGEDSLGYTSVYGITGTWNSGTGSLLLTGLKSLSSYETALRSIIYQNLLASPHTPTRIITFTVHDGGAYSNGITRTIASGTPATISGLDLWLNGNEGVFTNNAGTVDAVDGDDVQVWKDQSGNARDFINNAGTPFFRASVAGFNGESAIEFSGTGDESLRDADGENYINGLTEFTIFLVVKSNVTSTDKGLWLVRNPGNGDRDFSIRYDAVGDNSSELNVVKVAVLNNVAANEMESIAQIQTISSQIICLDWKSGQVWDLYIDGVLNNPSYSGSAPSGTISTASKIILGRGPADATGSWDGMVAEVVHYNKHLSESERKSIEDYFSDKYAISVRLLQPASGGEAISADDVGLTYTTLTGPRITEDIAGELTASGTIVLSAPSGFEWDIGGAVPAVTVKEAYGTSTTLAVSYTSRTSSDLTFTVNTESNSGSQPGEVIFSGIRVRPTSSTVPNTDNITNTGTTGPGGSTNFGTLTMVGGTATKVIYTQQPGTGTMNQTLSPEILAEIRDTNDNVIKVSGTAISIAITTGIGNLSGTTSLNTDIEGQVAFNDLAIDASGDFRLTSSSSGLTSAVCDSFIISNPGQFTTFLIEKLSGGNILAQTAGIEFNVKISAVDGSQTVDANFSGTVDITSSGTLSSVSGATAAFTSGVLASHTVVINSIGNYTLTATNSAGSESGTSNTFTVESGSASASMSEITASPTVLENDAVSTATITVQLKDAGGNNLSGGGETVNLVTTAGTLQGGVTDNSDGTYTQLLQSSSAVETATITGVLNGSNMTDDATVQFNAYTNIWESDPGNDPYTIDWGNALNWDNSIPGSSDAVLIPTNPADGTKYPIISTDNRQVASLTIETDADVTISGSISFDILGDLAGGGDINGGSLDTIRVSGDMSAGSSDIQYVEFNGSSLQVISSPLSFTNVTVNNASGVKTVGNLEVTGTLTLTNGSLIVQSGNSLIANTKSIGAGDIRAEREITGSTGWRLLSSPVFSTYGDLFSNIFTQGYTGSDSSSGSPSVLYYDETYTGTDNQRWRKPTNSTDATTAGRGLFVYVFGSISGEPAYSSTLPV